MAKHLKLFENHTDYAAFIQTEDFIRPNVSHCVNENDVHYNPIPHDYSKDYLTFVVKENGTISFNIWKSMGTDMITSISYSTDNGETWTTTQNTNDKTEHLVIDVNVNEGDKVLWKGTATQTGYYDEDDYADNVGSFFSSDCAFNAKGNVMSLLYGDNFKGKTTLEHEGQFTCLFSDYDGEKTCKIVNAKNLSLPATTLANACYVRMFNGCTSLTTAPELPATTLANGCYFAMFYNCTSLVNAPELPAQVMQYRCYSSMFKGCTSLVTAPVLPATTLANDCYQYMFNGCTSLTTAPELPATTLAESCYSSMFNGCTSLTTAPELPATTLANYCYQYMFQGCTSLNYIKAMFTTTPSDAYTKNWVNGVSATGTFVKNSAASWTTTGVHGIPEGWTIETASA